MRIIKKKKASPVNSDDNLNKVTVAKFRANLTRYIQHVRSGRSVIITSFREPVALLSSIVKPEKISYSPAERSPESIFKMNLEPTIQYGFSASALLLADRENS